ncbi:MAG: hypothetical protein RL385_3921, partial [Pseudomonadota bacterium]
MQLWAISDLHVEHAATQALLRDLAPRAADWLILAGDISDSVEGLRWALDVLAPKFARLFWVPGNHELWTRSTDDPALRGEGRY